MAIRTPLGNLNIRLVILLLALAAYRPLQTTLRHLTIDGEGHAPRLSHHSDTRTIQCYGMTKESKSCLLRDAWYHVSSSTFTLPGFTDAELDQFGLDHLYPFKISARQRVRNVDASEVLDIENHTLFWEFVDPGAENSLGHAFVFELFPLYLVASTILGDGILPLLNLLYVNDRVPRVFEEKASPFKGRMLQWDTLQVQARESNKEWIRFEAVILGDGGISAMAQRNGHDNDPNRAYNAFNNLRWWGFRNWMLAAAGIDENAKTRGRTKIIVNDKRAVDGSSPETMDRRQILNVDDVVHHLQLGFPNADVGINVELTWARETITYN